MKRCSVCKIEKPKSDFYNNRSKKDGLQCACKPCHNQNNYKWKSKNRGKANEISARWRRNNPIRYKEIQARGKYKFLYGITLEEKRQMYLEQDGKCLICKKEMLTSKDCHVDHDHITGTVRGILHSKCNMVLGAVNDDPEILIAAAEYLMKHNRKGGEARTNVQTQSEFSSL